MAQKSSQDGNKNGTKAKSQTTLGIVEEAQKKAVTTQKEFQKQIQDLYNSSGMQSLTEAMRSLEPHLEQMRQIQERLTEPAKQLARMQSEAQKMVKKITIKKTQY